MSGRTAAAARHAVHRRLRFSGGAPCAAAVYATVAHSDTTALFGRSLELFIAFAKFCPSSKRITEIAKWPNAVAAGSPDGAPSRSARAGQFDARAERRRTACGRTRPTQSSPPRVRPISDEWGPGSAYQDSREQRRYRQQRRMAVPKGMDPEVAEAEMVGLVQKHVESRLLVGPNHTHTHGPQRAGPQVLLESSRKQTRSVESETAIPARR